MDLGFDQELGRGEGKQGLQEGKEGGGRSGKDGWDSRNWETVRSGSRSGSMKLFNKLNLSDTISCKR